MQVEQLPPRRGPTRQIAELDSPAKKAGGCGMEKLDLER